MRNLRDIVNFEKARCVRVCVCVCVCVRVCVCVCFWNIYIYIFVYVSALRMLIINAISNVN